MAAILRPLAIAAATAAATLLALEALFRCLPVSTSTQVDYHFDRDVITYPAHHRWTVATGWDLRNVQHLRSNAMGFSSDIEFTPNPDALVLIGDSYVESASLKPADRPAPQLALALQGARPVYGMGSPGTAMLDYAQRVRFASERLQARDFVIWLEDLDARQALCGSGHVVSRCLDPQTLQPRTERLPSASGGLKQYARHSALAQYIFSQLKFNPAKLMAALPGGQAGKAQAAPARDEAAMHRAVDAVLDEFFAQVQPVLKGRLLFVVDGSRGVQPLPTAEINQERSYVVRRLRERGAQVVDLEPVFAAHLKQSRLSPEIGPYDRHLNALGVKLVMQAAAAGLQAGKP